MIRAPLGSLKYWNKWATFRRERIEKEWYQVRHIPSQNPIYESQYVFNISQNQVRYLLTLYSRGDPVNRLSQYFEGVLDGWELSNSLSNEICRSQKLKTCRDWSFELSDLNHYNYCFWLVGLALLLDVSDAQWRRLLALVQGASEDILLDRIIATREPRRVIGNVILHDKPYGRLLKVIEAPQSDQPVLLRDFVDHWYEELARKGKDELWWYTYGDPEKHPLEMGSYFGRWCIEAAAVAKAFKINDSLCVGHEHYPGDFLRPNSSSTHEAKPVSAKNWLSRIFKMR